MPDRIPAKLLHPADDFIGEHLPPWLKNAAHEQVQALRASMTAHLQSQKDMAAALQALQPLEQFAAQRLEQALKDQLKLDIDVTHDRWREERRRLEVVQGSVRNFESYFVTVPLLQKLLQNFKNGESYFEQTAVIREGQAPDGAEQVLTQRIDEIVSLCRRVDVGKAYQEHLKQTLTPAFRRQLAKDTRLCMAAAVEIAAMKGQLAGSDLRMLRQLGKGEPAQLPSSLRLGMGVLQVLGQAVDGALAFEWTGTVSGMPGLVFNPDRLQAVLLYLPDDREQPFQRFDDWASANRTLARLMCGADFRKAIARRIALDKQVDYQLLLRKRLQDDEPDLEPGLLASDGELFASLAARHVRRIEADAAFLAVPTAQANARSAAARLQALETAGLVLLNLVGLFVPVVGALLLVDLARQVLGHVFEGSGDWLQGHQHEATEHLLEVAATLATGATVTAGGQVLRSTFVEQLEPVTTEAGEQRLWRYDLQPYEQRSTTASLTELDNGLLSDGQAYWWRRDAVLYRVRRDAAGTWRLLHRDGPGVFGPALESNGERAWRLAWERPLAWQGAQRLVKGLWPGAAELDAERITQILAVADVDEAYLRGLWVEGRPLPIRLRDTLERFAADARVDAFFAQVDVAGDDTEALQWCIDTLELQGENLVEQTRSIRQSAERLRGPMLEHFAQRYLAPDPLLATLKGSFPGLPDAYALDLLKSASAESRERMTNEARVPLALAERARGALQQARLTRMREVLYLPNSYRADTVSLAFSLLRRRGLTPGGVNLVLREGSATGPVLDRLFPERNGAQSVTEMVWREGRFELFDDMGRTRDIEVAQPEGLFEVLAACLPPTFLQRQGWTGEDAAGRIRSSFQTWLPRDRLELIRLLGWREARPMAPLMHRLADGRAGYLLSGRGASSQAHGQVLRRRIGSLYPAFDDEEVERYLQLLLAQSSSAYTTLLRQEGDYRRMDQALRLWTDAVAETTRGHRQAVADALRRAWRLEGERVIYRNGEPGGMRLSIIGVPAGSLPTLPEGTDFTHITDMVLVGMRLESLPAGFLRTFPELRRLDLGNNALRAIPEGLAGLTRLRHLRLPRNRIRLTAPHVDALAGLARLRILDLSENMLGSISLRFNQLSRLRELHLSRAGLQAVPRGLEWCGLLEYADLRGNQISSLPQALLDAPLALRRAVWVDGNPLTAADRERLLGPEAEHAHGQVPDAEEPAEAADPLRARTTWLGALAEPEQAAKAAQWDALQGEPGHVQFFQLLAELTESSDFRVARDDLLRRVWAMIDAATSNTLIRDELFERAADPRTCVDSVAHCFSQLEIRMRVLQVTHGENPVATRNARLELAQRLFRLDQVEHFARADFQARLAEGRGVDEVEVSLAYRTGLASRLNLIGQPRSMQFHQVAGVASEDLDRVYLAVLNAEAGDERVRYISQRDYWQAYLRERYPEAFEQISSDFSKQIDELEEEKEALGSGAYVQRCKQLRRDTEQAYDALALRLTQDEMNVPALSQNNT
ncbi:NEL-type E3 ubiquitin ligase domain-containing protein [Pseudomonas sp. 43(2021)]|uniref:NEL-type E3 ubiquitin ligase domain-containing protein n=1 Tax=Pseudomonas sp. 43(2021) TaxID=2813560 RepID=UPI001A9EB022|nr:NEL-type E3 ubiquitin ligase domain-containing protein [Pseudomonas sp. 43(2021)]